jgi:hypothetical protein
MDEAAWIAIVTVLGGIVIAMIVPILSGTWVRRVEYDKIKVDLDHERELGTIKDLRIKEKDNAIGLLEKQRDMLEVKADLSTDVLMAVRAAVQGGGKA